MSIKTMHYSFKRKLNKIDSQQYKGLLIPEIDMLLNEAYEIFVKMVASPRYRKLLGFEKSQRNIDDIRVLVKTETDAGNCITPANNIATLPDDYWYYLSSYVLMTKDNCQNVKGKVNIVQHDDEAELSPFNKSSFKWREVNAVFFENGVKFLNDSNEFSITSFCLSYLKKLTYMHNAEDYNDSGYNLPDGTSLTGTQDCELPEETHEEIVDLAVLLAKGELEHVRSYQLKQAKLNLNDLNT